MGTTSNTTSTTKISTTTAQQSRPKMLNNQHSKLNAQRPKGNKGNTIFFTYYFTLNHNSHNQHPTPKDPNLTTTAQRPKQTKNPKLNTQPHTAATSSNPTGAKINYIKLDPTGAKFHATHLLLQKIDNKQERLMLHL